MQLLTTIRSPTRESALTTYQGRLVLVGGREVATGYLTNKLWSLQDDGTWAEDLPPMPTRRRSATAVSTGHHLLVASGMREDGGESAVEVFDGKRWSTTEPLPKEFHDMKSALLDGEWYLMGGWRQDRSVFSASVAALLTSAGTGERTLSVWKKLPEAPLKYSSLAVFGGLLLAIGGRAAGHRGRRSDAIHAFIPDTLSWLHVADLPEPMHSASSLVLPSGDLLVVNKETFKYSISIFKASLKVNSFPDGRLSIAALECLQYAAGVQLFLSIGTKWTQFAPLIGIEYSPIRQSPEECGRQLIEKWLEGKSDEPATWMSLVEILMMSKETYSLANTISIFFSTRVDTSDRYTRILQKCHRQTEEIERLMASKTDRGMRVTEIPRAILLRPQREAFPIKSMDPSTLAPSPQYSIRSGEPITGLITAKMDREIARAYPLRPLGKDFPIKSMAPPSISPYSSRRFLSGDSGVEERADAQEESDALRDLEDQMDTLTMGYLRGVDVVAKTSFEVTSQAHTYEWRGYGVKLHIQQDSLPADCPQCRVEMRASLSGQYALPADCELVSGVYWVCCPVKLSKRATLEVQHCSTQIEGLSFVRAECTQEQLPYMFRRQEGGVFSEHSSHGSIELSRFSGWGIGRLQISSIFPLPSFFTSDSQQPYSAEVYYTSDKLNSWKVFFTIRRRRGLDLEDMEFQEFVEATIRQKITEVGSLFPVEFTAYTIKLNLPDSPTGWNLTCPSYPAIHRRIVDGFRARRGNLFPYCQISVSGTAADVGSKLSVKVDLAGAKEPYNYFMLQCGPTSGPAPQPHSVRPSEPASTAGPAPQPQPVRPSESARPAANLQPSWGQLQSPELRVFQEKRLFLHIGIINNVRDIALRAFARGLIPDGVSRNITDTQSQVEKTDLLLRELESRIKIDRTVLTQFVDVLRESDAACYAPLMSTITEALDSARAAVNSPPPPAEQQH